MTAIPVHVWVLSIGESSEGHDPKAVFSTAEKAKEWADKEWPEHSPWEKESKTVFMCHPTARIKVDEIYLEKMRIDPRW